MPRGQIHDWRLRLLFLGAELFAASVAVFVLEGVLVIVRSSRRTRATRASVGSVAPR